MIKRIAQFFAPLPDQEVLEANPKKLKRLQWSFFISATLGYGLYYVCRMSLNVVKKPLVDGGVLTEQELGLVGSALFFTYAIGKLVNGFIGDRVIPASAVGLLVSSLVNVILGFSHSFWVFVVSGESTGGVQTWALPAAWWACPGIRIRIAGRSMVSGVPAIGEALTFIATAAVVSITGWRWGSRWRNCGFVGHGHHPALYVRTVPRAGASLGDSDRERERECRDGPGGLMNPYIWILALSSACMYVSRYAIIVGASSFGEPEVLLRRGQQHCGGELGLRHRRNHSVGVSLG